MDKKSNGSYDEFVINKLKYRIKKMNFLIQGIEIYGTEKFKMQLKELGIFKTVKSEPIFNVGYYFGDKNDEKIVEFILKTTIKEFGLKVTNERFIKSNRRLDYSLVKGVVMVLIKENTNLTDTKISSYFNRSRQVVFNKYEEHRLKLRKKSQYKSYFYKFNRIQEKINKFKKLNKIA